MTAKQLHCPSCGHPFPRKALECPCCGTQRPSYIHVEYDGDYPNTCSGTLTIRKDGVKIYSKQFCCHSTGSVWFDDDWNEHVEEGTLMWEECEAEKFPSDIQEAVADKLSGYHVCCGGCV